MRITFIAQLLAMALFFSKLSFAGFFSSPKIGAQKNQEGKCFRTYLKSNGGVIHEIQKNSLEWHYCDRMFANSYGKVFDQNVGVPAIENKEDQISLIEVNEVEPVAFYPSMLNNEGSKYIYASHDGVSPYSTSDEKSYGLESNNKLDNDYLKNSSDWESLEELNLKARSLWQDVVVGSMKETTLEQRFERARELYFKGKLPRKIDKEIESFKSEVLAFLNSSEVQVNYGLSLIQNYHPFFTQIILEQFAVYYFNAGYGIWPKDIQLQISEAWVMDSMISQYGKSYLSQNYSNYIADKYIDQIQYLKKKVNVLMLLTMMTPKNCSKFGLRPELARTMIQKFYLGTFVGSGIDNFMAHIVRNNMVQCGVVFSAMPMGDYEPYFHAERGEIKSIVKKYKDLALDKKNIVIGKDVFDFGRKQ
ncbi:hypothetical protein M899_2803 [Bacteriovorax sp. BSW11_IV]|uniref:hypothetical protein n=1 Tax=Bacteriovorax sp. BSW11_IV TaxID=1353529 RepID=UPI00038A208F|nr:hypothetical protein [Bacteriovorax sp. BSW11_IV]EQC48207.1 hypothetical protein M899_2803 [Bacteriovorax sp. BSW11_IV]